MDLIIFFKHNWFIGSLVFFIYFSLYFFKSISYFYLLKLLQGQVNACFVHFLSSFSSPTYKPLWILFFFVSSTFAFSKTRITQNSSIPNFFIQADNTNMQRWWTKRKKETKRMKAELKGHLHRNEVRTESSSYTLERWKYNCCTR